MKKGRTKPVKGSWVVRMEVTKTIDVVCENCTEDEARENPWEHVVGDELEIEQRDWEVTSVKENA